MSAFDALAEAMAARFSCRAFLPASVPKDTINQIVQAARHVPSWCNAQPWQVIVTAGATTDRFRSALYDVASTTPPAPDLPWPDSYPGIYGERRRACGFQLYDAVGVTKGDRAATSKQMMENYNLFGAPHVAIITSPRVLGAYGAMDTGGFLTAFCFAAQALGVATIQQAAIAALAPFVRAHFDIPQDRMFLCAVSFGYADHDHPANTFRTKRAEVDDIMGLARRLSAPPLQRRNTATTQNDDARYIRTRCGDTARIAARQWLGPAAPLWSYLIKCDVI